MGNQIVCLRRVWRYIAYMLVALSFVLIFFFSGQDGDTSTSLSTQTAVAVIRTITGKMPNTRSVEFDRVHHLIRKLAHAAEYGMLAASFALLTHTFAVSDRKRFGFPAAVCLLTASLDECQQTYRVARNGSIVDVGIDMCAVFFALLFFFLIWRAALRSGNCRR